MHRQDCINLLSHNQKKSKASVYILASRGDSRRPWRLFVTINSDAEWTFKNTKRMNWTLPYLWEHGQAYRSGCCDECGGCVMVCWPRRRQRRPPWFCAAVPLRRQRSPQTPYAAIPLSRHRRHLCWFHIRRPLSGDQSSLGAVRGSKVSQDDLFCTIKEMSR